MYRLQQPKARIQSNLQRVHRFTMPSKKSKEATRNYFGVPVSYRIQLDLVTLLSTDTYEILRAAAVYSPNHSLGMLGGRPSLHAGAAAREDDFNLLLLYFQAKISKSNQARPKSKTPALEKLSWSQEDTTSRSCYGEGIPRSYSLGTSFTSSRQTNMSSIQMAPVPVNNIQETARSVTVQPELGFE